NPSAAAAVSFQNSAASFHLRPNRLRGNNLLDLLYLFPFGNIIFFGLETCGFEFASDSFSPMFPSRRRSPWASAVASEPL
ncbi:hypothetical protein M2T53_28420, partial [Klebsiella pneumoniae]|nr:hypothetical protein [Klebsiella pneumoniae]